MGEDKGLICIEPADADDAEYKMLRWRGWTPYHKEYINLPGIIYRAERNMVTAGGFCGVVTICRRKDGAWYAYYRDVHTADEASAYGVLQDIEFLTGVEGEWTRMKLKEAPNDRGRTD